jgi:hypothetical protein
VVKDQKFLDVFSSLLFPFWLPLLLVLPETSNNTRYEQNDWQWSEGSGAREFVLYNIADGGA